MTLGHKGGAEAQVTWPTAVLGRGVGGGSDAECIPAAGHRNPGDKEEGWDGGRHGRWSRGDKKVIKHFLAQLPAELKLGTVQLPGRFPFFLSS